MMNAHSFFRYVWAALTTLVFILGVAVDVFQAYNVQQQGGAGGAVDEDESPVSQTRKLRVALSAIAFGQVAAAVITAFCGLMFVKGYRFFQPFMGGDSFIALQAVAITALASSLILFLGYGCTHSINNTPGGGSRVLGSHSAPATTTGISSALFNDDCFF